MGSLASPAPDTRVHVDGYVINKKGKKERDDSMNEGQTRRKQGRTGRTSLLFKNLLDDYDRFSDRGTVKINSVAIRRCGTVCTSGAW